MSSVPARQSLRVEILGQQLTLRADGDPDRLARLAQYVQSKVAEVAARGPILPSRLALLAAFNVADDYFRAQEELQAFKHQVAEKSRAMLHALDGEEQSP